MDLKSYSEYLLQQIESLILSSKELVYRRNALQQASNSESQNNVSIRYYNLVHELKSLIFLSKYGKLTPSADHAHEAGCDTIVNGHYQIEFVCTSRGKNRDQNGYAPIFANTSSKVIIGDYSEKERFLYSRITNVLEEKRKFYEDHSISGTISTHKPYLIFVGLGELAYEMFCGDCGIEFTGVLLGKGCPYIAFNSNDLVVDRGYTHNDTFPKIIKNKTVDLDCNLFCKEEYRCISGVIFTKAKLFEEYTTSNTWLFINPLANVKIIKKDFPGLIYWSERNGVYQPRRNGKHIV